MAVDRTDAGMQQLINMFGDCTKIKKLWQNASPTSVFTPQKISLDLAGYTHVLVLYYCTTPVTNGLGSVIVPVGSYGYCNIATSINRYRVFQVLTTGVNFNKVSKWTYYNQSADDDNGPWLIPYIIYGLKGVK